MQRDLPRFRSCQVRQVERYSNDHSFTRPYRYIDTKSDLNKVLVELDAQPRFALDTEFHRERTYWPEVSLLQIAWPGNVVVIDVLAIDARCLAALIDSDKLVVLHAASQDLQALERVCDTIPQRIFDTQIAAGFIGRGVPSLASLYENELGLKLAKEQRLTDWLARPLSETQLEYAANDVAYLLEIHDLLSVRLNELRRLGWVEAECKLLLEAHIAKIWKPEEAWRKINGFRRLQGQAMAVGRSLAMWRQERAADIDRPIRHVMSDMTVVSISMAMPTSKTKLAQVRGLNKSMLVGDLADGILSSVDAGLKSKWRVPSRPRSSLSLKRIRPVVDLMVVWVRQLAEENQIEASLLATRADIETLVRGEDETRLAKGWRAEMIGEPIHQLMNGEAALAFDDDGVILERRSHCPVS